MIVITIKIVTFRYNSNHYCNLERLYMCCNECYSNWKQEIHKKL